MSAPRPRIVLDTNLLVPGVVGATAGKADMLVTNNVDDFREIAALPGGTADLCYRGVRVVGLGACLAAIRATHADAERAMRRPRRWP